MEKNEWLAFEDCLSKVAQNLTADWPHQAMMAMIDCQQWQEALKALDETQGELATVAAVFGMAIEADNAPASQVAEVINATAYEIAFDALKMALEKPTGLPVAVYERPAQSPAQVQAQVPAK